MGTGTTPAPIFIADSAQCYLVKSLLKEFTISFIIRNQNPSFMVCMISLYCSVVSAFVFLFMDLSLVKFAFSFGLVRKIR